MNQNEDEKDANGFAIVNSDGNTAIVREQLIFHYCQVLFAEYLDIDEQSVQLAVRIFMLNYQYSNTYSLSTTIGACILAAAYLSGDDTIPVKLKIMKSFHTSLAAMKMALFYLFESRGIDFNLSLFQPKYILLQNESVIISNSDILNKRGGQSP
jgi:hypothetical protein